MRVGNLKEDYFGFEPFFCYFCPTGSFVASRYHRPGETPPRLTRKIGQKIVPGGIKLRNLIPIEKMHPILIPTGNNYDLQVLICRPHWVFRVLNNKVFIPIEILSMNFIPTG